MRGRPDVRTAGSPGVSWAWGVLVMVLSVFVSGCGRETPPVQGVPADDALALAQRVVAHHGMAANITAQLLVRVRPAGMDAQIATVNLWSPADGRVRLSASRVGFSGIEGLISADGSLLAVVRDGEVIRDSLRTAFVEVLGPQARPERLIEDLKAGPLPLATTFTRTDAGLSCIDPGTGLRVEVDLAADGLSIERKRWYLADGTEALRIDYARPQVFDGLRRAASWTVTIAVVDAQIQLRIQDIDVVPQIGEARLRLEAPAGEAVDIAGFLAGAAGD